MEYVDNFLGFSVLNSVQYMFENYGWHILIGTVIFAIIYTKKLKPSVDHWIEQYRNRKFEEEYAARYHKNPDVFSAHITAQQRYVEKLQEKYNREAEERERKLKEREEKKKQELIEKYGDVAGGTRLGEKSRDNKEPTDQNKRSFKPEYNPLMGAGSSSSYRPPKKSGCGGGGCGKK